MVIQKTKIFLSIILILGTIFITSPRANALCTSQKCKDAAAAEEAAREKASNAESAANTLEDEVERLNSEIAMYEARIATNIATAEDLSKEIEENLEKLNLQQAALANLLVDLHFDEQPEAIMILAGSSSISDYAERQARADSVKEQVAVSAQAVKTLKKELEDQKAEVERVIADQEIQQKNIAAKRNEQNELKEKYRDNAEAFTAEAEEARKQKESAIAEEIASMNRGRSGTVIAVSNASGYPYSGSCPHNNLGFIDDWGYYGCQCTSYAAYRVVATYGVVPLGWGNANTWGYAASSLGYRVDYSPAVHTVAVSTLGAYGHVMWVEAVHSDGTIDLSEYNNYSSSASGLPGDYGYRVNVNPSDYGYQFIHFD